MRTGGEYKVTNKQEEEEKQREEERSREEREVPMGLPIISW